MNTDPAYDAKLQIARECLADAMASLVDETRSAKLVEMVDRAVALILAGGWDDSIEIDACLRAMQRAWGTVIMRDGDGNIEVQNCFAYGVGGPARSPGKWRMVADWVKEKLA